MSLKETKKEKLAQGKEAEKRFLSLFEGSTQSTVTEDRYEHWDVLIPLKGEDVKVDVKGLRTKEDKVNEEFSYIELRNVRGQKGWLYGDADMFAFEIEDYWILVRKEELQEFIASKVEKVKVSQTKDLLYKLYQRKGREDLITMVKIVDLMYLAEEIIIKR